MLLTSLLLVKRKNKNVPIITDGIPDNKSIVDFIIFFQMCLRNCIRRRNNITRGRTNSDDKPVNSDLLS